MKVNLQELRGLVESILSEAKKKKEKADDTSHVPEPPEYRYAEALDFSSPLGAYNLYRSQGAVNWGPMTGPGPKVDDRISVPRDSKLAESLRQMADVIPEGSAWGPFLAEARKPAPDGIWEAALHWYDFQERGLGKVNERATCGPEGEPEEGDLDEKKIGFKKLKAKLAHRKGVKDPGALAAYIGRKKYGAKGMAKKAAAGRK